MENADRPRVVVLSTGGTIAGRGGSTLSLTETAYFLNLTVRHDRPVVLVGSQRPATALSADGPLNLVSAVRTAACPESRGRGVLVVLNDEINAARDVTKSNTYRPETFRSGELGFPSPPTISARKKLASCSCSRSRERATSMS